MKTITTKEFEKLLKSDGWKITEQSFEDTDTVISPIETEIDGSPKMIEKTVGHVETTAKLGELSVTHCIDYEYYGNDSDNKEYYYDENEYTYNIRNFRLVDEDGRELDRYDLDNYFEELDILLAHNL